MQLQQVVLNLIINAIQAMSADAEGPRELFDHHRSSRTEWRAGRGEGFGAGLGPGESRAALRPVLHDEARRFGDGAVDLPFDHRSSWGPVVGDRQPAPRRHFSLHGAHSRGQRIVNRAMRLSRADIGPPMLASVSRGACNRSSCGSLRAAVADVNIVGHTSIARSRCCTTMTLEISLTSSETLGDLVDNTDPHALRRLIEQQELGVR